MPIELNPGDVTLQGSFNLIGIRDVERITVGYKPPKGRKFAVLLLGDVDGVAREVDVESMLADIGFVPAAQRAGDRVDVTAEMVDVLRIPAQPGLDPIVVYFEDSAPGRGRITVACFGDAWTAAWGAMGDRTVREFVSSVDSHYLTGAMQELTASNKARRAYTERIATAIIAALRTGGGSGHG